MEDMRAVEAIVDVRSGSAWASDQVPSHGYEEYLWSDGAFVCIGTTRRFGATSVRIEVLSAAPTAEPPDDWQHVAEVSLDENGDLEVYSWDDRSPASTVPLDRAPQRRGAALPGLAAEPAPSQVTRWWAEASTPASVPLAEAGVLERRTEPDEQFRWASPPGVPRGALGSSSTGIGGDLWPGEHQLTRRPALSPPRCECQASLSVI